MVVQLVKPWLIFHIGVLLWVMITLFLTQLPPNMLAQTCGRRAWVHGSLLPSGRTWIEFQTPHLALTWQGCCGHLAAETADGRFLFVSACVSCCSSTHFKMALNSIFYIIMTSAKCWLFQIFSWLSITLPPSLSLVLSSPLFLKPACESQVLGQGKSALFCFNLATLRRSFCYAFCYYYFFFL